MDEPARKRRRTASPEEPDRPPSPWKNLPRRPLLADSTAAGAEPSRSPLKEPPRRPSASPTKATFDRGSSPLKQPPRRPSFVSPTKASLARNYPDLLPKRPPSSASAASKQNGRGDILARRKQARAFVLGEKDARQQAILDTAAEEEHADHASAGAEQLRLSKPQNVTPRARRTIRMGDVSEEDAELPSTPSQRTQEEQDTPRRGILFSSPSKKPPRLQDPVKPSPLRPKAQPVRENRSAPPEDGPVGEGDPRGAAKEKLPPDPELERRKQEKAHLMRELKELEGQVSRCTEEIVKIQEQSATHILQPSEREDLIAFINKISNASTEADEQQPPAISSLLCSFLPFSTLAVPPPKSKEAAEKPVASHRPLDLDDPLPYLEMFTCFKWTTQLSLPRGRVFPASNRVHSKHTIDIAGPQKLLTSSISIVIDALTNSIIDLKILRLSSWAERELGSFMRAKAQEQDLGNACWAIGSYWEIARKRAEFWRKCVTAFGDLISGRTGEDTENVGLRETKKDISRRDLNRHLGRDILVLQDGHVLLKVSWKIGFDWTGEAESEIRVEPAVPQVWSEADSNNSFRKIPQTFDSLLQSKGAFAATKTLVALLFAE
ncbi:hypothetical protein BU26DRAFT_492158 [Trematosphaeria pertusa]|uniref:Uncharacterized protein n=1 Tax=Trematosphaeria pertusa TaxID=390896 RepID=A0A6A6I2K0_9PLEO|nr:uncharacterized protein BU26DRAFT_492158 [Trematosphaeria pertusa]KAF2244507.1 hypothetical protein BU26DRAFT_492158 [Trematosphaeria pertusa]